MKNSRIQGNPAAQNESLYDLIFFDSTEKIVDGDYYIMRRRPIGTTQKFRESGNYLPFFLSNKPIHNKEQHAIIIKQDCCRAVFESIDWETEFYKGISWDGIQRADIHQAYNKQRLEMGL